MKKDNLLTWTIFAFLTTVMLLLINTGQEQQINLEYNQQLEKKIEEYSSDSFWVGKLARYELRKFKHIPLILLEDRSYMMSIRGEMLEESEAVAIITKEITRLKLDYLDQLDLFNQYQVIDYILNNATPEEDHTDLIKSYLLEYYSRENEQSR